MDFYPIPPVEFDQHLKPLTGNVISMDFYPIQPVEFDRHLKPLTGNVISVDFHPIQPGINYWSKIGRNSLRLHHHLNEK